MQAAIKNDNFSCQGCQDYNPVEIRYASHEKAGMQALLKAIFTPQKKKKYFPHITSQNRLKFYRSKMAHI